MTQCVKITLYEAWHMPSVQQIEEFSPALHFIIENNVFSSMFREGLSTLYHEFSNIRGSERASWRCSRASQGSTKLVV